MCGHSSQNSCVTRTCAQLSISMCALVDACPLICAEHGMKAPHLRLRSIWRVSCASVAMHVLCICAWYAQVMGPHPLQEFQSLFAGSPSSAMDLWPGWPANVHPRNVLGTVGIYICTCKCNQSKLTQPHKRLDQTKSIKCKHQQTCVVIQLGNALPLARDFRTAPLSDV